jgi:hypothetical protein
MPAGTFTFYTRNFGALNIDDLLAADVRLALVTSSYTPNVDETSGHDEWADVSANQIAGSGGYTTGGQALASKAKVAGTNAFAFDSADVVWTASGGGIAAHRYAVMYVNGSLWGLTSPLVGYFLSDNAPADIPITTAGNTLTYQAPSPGWFDVS